MAHSFHRLAQALRGRVCLVGLGNEELGDDGLGVRLARRLTTALRPTATVTLLTPGTRLESMLHRLTSGDFDTVLIVDAVDCGALPGAAVALEGMEIVDRFPQVSTHRLSLGLVARWVESRSRSRCWLLGVQPHTLRAGPTLSPPVAEALELLVQGLTPEMPNPTHPPAVPAL